MFIKSDIFKYVFLLTVPVFLFFYLFFKSSQSKKIKNRKKIEKCNFQKVNLHLSNLENEKKLIQDNQADLQEELNKLKRTFNLKVNLERDRVKSKFLNKVECSKMDKLLLLSDLESINLEIDEVQKVLNDKKLRLHSLDLDRKNIEPQLDNLSKIQESLVRCNEKMLDLKNLDFCMNLAKEVLYEAYEEMKSLVTPKFTENLSNNISQITNGKYDKVMFSETEGLIVELKNGDYVSANRLSVATIDQLYLSLRLSLVDELSDESVPLFLDEPFAFFDDERLSSVLLFLNSRFGDRQIVIFSCTGRESCLMDSCNIDYNFVQLL